MESKRTEDKRVFAVRIWAATGYGPREDLLLVRSGYAHNSTPRTHIHLVAGRHKPDLAIFWVSRKPVNNPQTIYKVQDTRH